MWIDICEVVILGQYGLVSGRCLSCEELGDGISEGCGGPSNDVSI